MIDLHCHILPGLDDGARFLDHSLAMAEIAEKDGISKIVATPHIRTGSPAPDKITTACLNLNEALRKRGFKLEILPGAETNAITNPAILADRTINATRYILIEFPLTHLPTEASQILFNLQVNGFRPIIAHPERIPNVISQPKILEKMLGENTFIQITADSLTGSFGSGPEKCARYLLKKGLVNFIASDAHGVFHRRPRLSSALEIATSLIGKEAASRLVFANPAAVIAGEDVDG